MARTPTIDRITLPSGNTYYLADLDAREMIAGGINFDVVWNETDYNTLTAPASAKLATIPNAVTVYYHQGTETATGTLAASSQTVATFYLIYSKTQSGDKDYYDEYVTIKTSEDKYWVTTSAPADWATNYTSYFTKSGSTYTPVPAGSGAPTWAAGLYYSPYAWEKIGDTLIDLSNVVQSLSYSNGVDPGVVAYPDANGDIDIGNLVENVARNGDLNKVVTIMQESGETYYVLSDAYDQLSRFSYAEIYKRIGSIEGTIFTYIYPSGEFEGLVRTFMPVWLGSQNGTYYLYLVSVIDLAGTLSAQTFVFTASSASGELHGTSRTTSIISSVTLNKSTDTVIGSDATFSVTDPSVSVTVTPSQTYLGATASGASTAWNSKDEVTAVTGVSATKTNIKATASGAAVSASGDNVTVVTGYASPATDSVWGASSTISASGDSVTVVTGYASPTTDTFVKSVSAETNKNLVTTSVYGVQSTTTTASKVTTTSQTTATGSGTTSSTNTDWLKGVSVSDGNLTIGAATLATQTTYSAGTVSDVTVPIKATTATTVATGATSTEGTGDAVVTGVTIGSSASAITGLGAASTDTVLGTSSTFSVSGDNVTALTGLGTASTDTVLGTASTFSVTQPTIALATGATAGAGVIEVATDASASGTDKVIGSDSTFTITQPTIALASNNSTAAGRVQVATGITSATGSASGTAVAWNSKDQVTVLTDSTSITAS